MTLSVFINTNRRERGGRGRGACLCAQAQEGPRRFYTAARVWSGRRPSRLNGVVFLEIHEALPARPVGSRFNTSAHAKLDYRASVPRRTPRADAHRPRVCTPRSAVRSNEGAPYGGPAPGWAGAEGAENQVDCRFLQAINSEVRSINFL